MGICVDRIVAYTVDINDIELCGLEDEINGLKIYDRTFNLHDGHLAIVNDGMCGEYTKLCYILFCEHDCDDYSDSSFYTELNKLFDTISQIPSYVEIELMQALNVIGLEKETLSIKLETFRHYY